MMASSPIHWPAESLWPAIEPQLPGFSVEIVPSIGSTTTDLMASARDGRNQPVLLATEVQTGGRGRLRQAWRPRGRAGAELLGDLGRAGEVRNREACDDNAASRKRAAGSAGGERFGSRDAPSDSKSVTSPGAARPCFLPASSSPSSACDHQPRRDAWACHSVQCGS